MRECVSAKQAVTLRICGAGDKLQARLFIMKNDKTKDKTNVIRLLEQHKVPYKSYDCNITEALSGVEVAKLLGQDPDRMYKTLVTVGKSKGHHVFVIPVAKELDLKKAARAAGEKSIEMLKQKDLLPLTGYVHGGCSPIGMKKQFATILDASAAQFDTIGFSAGKIGCQVEIKPDDLSKLIPFSYADVTTEA